MKDKWSEQLLHNNSAAEANLCYRPQMINDGKYVIKIHVFACKILALELYNTHEDLIVRSHISANFNLYCNRAD